MKLIALTSAILLAGYSAVASSGQPVPPAPPAAYNGGPSSPLVATTDLSDAERAAYALYETVILVTKAKIHATSCGATAGSYNVDIFANGRLQGASGEDNDVTVTSFGGDYSLDAALQPKVDFRGQAVKINQVPSSGVFDGKAVANAYAEGRYNEANNMLVMDGRVDVVGLSGRFDRYQSRLIKDFYRGALQPGGPSVCNTISTGERKCEDPYYLIYDWGLEALAKLGYPTNKYWQRSKSRRDNGTIGKTVFVQDRLVGTTSCRIVIDTEGFNNQDIFWQSGTLTVSTDTPSASFPWEPLD